MSKFYGDVNYGQKVKIDPNELRVLNRRIAELEAKVEALIPKPETETVKVYFYYDACQNIVYPTNSPTSIWERFAIKEVTVTKGEGL